MEIFKFKNLSRKPNGYLYEISREILIYGFGNGLSKFLTIFLTPILTSVFSPYKLGIIDIIASSSFLLTIFLSLNLESSIQRYFYELKDNIEKKILITTTIIFILLLSIPLILLVFIFKDQLSILLSININYSYLLIISIITVTLQLNYSIILLYFRLLNQPIKYLSFNTLLIFLHFFLTTIFILLLEWGVEGYFVANIFSNLIALIFIVIFNKNIFLLKINFSLIIKCLKFALPGFPSVLISSCILVAPRYLILSYSNLNDVGLYAFALKLSGLLSLIIYSFQMAWYPFSLKIMHNQDSKEIYNQVYRFTFLILLVLACIMVTTSQFLLNIFGNYQYKDSLPFFYFLLLANLTGFQIHFFHLPFSIIEKTIFISLSQLINIIILIIIGVILIYIIGSIGAVIALIIGNLSGVNILYILSKKFYFIKFDIHKINYSLIGFFIYILLFIYISKYEIAYSYPFFLFFISYLIIFLLEKNEISKILNKIKK